MSRKSWTITDVEADIHLEQLRVGPGEVGGAARGYSVTKRTLRGGLREGVEIIEVDNGVFRFVALPTRGMGVWRADCGNVQLGWRSPVHGPVHPAFVPLWEGTGLGWLSGFDEWCVRCGLESNGAPEFFPTGALRYPLHGKIANTPAHRVEVSIDGSSGEISLQGVVDESRLFGNKLRMTSTLRTRAGLPGMTILDEVQNLSAEPGELELLYHMNFGVPLLSPGARLVAPVAKVAPRDALAAADIGHWDVYDPETPGLGEACFFFELSADAEGQTIVLLRSADGSRGVSLRFNKRQLPCFTLWKQRQAVPDGYVTGIEPATNYPNRRSFEKEKGRVVVLGPGESRRFEISVEVHADAAGVSAAEAAVAAIQDGRTPKVCEKPDPNWAAG